MSRRTQVAPEFAAGKAKGPLDAVKDGRRLAANKRRATANALTALRGCRQPRGALGQGVSPSTTREPIARVAPPSPAAT